MNELPQHWQNLIALAMVLGSVFTGIGLYLLRFRLLDLLGRFLTPIDDYEPVEVIDEDLDLPPKKRPRQHYVDGG